jgi:aryl-alcohol dehydrogenase-like predicted oxidoreductase
VTVSSGVDLVTLGKTGIKTTVLGMGTGTRGGREQRDLLESGFVDLMQHAYDRGIRYIDTADMYRTHELVRATLKQLPREDMFIQTKTRAKDAAAAKADIERFRREMDIETLDTVLVHCMTQKAWTADWRPVIDTLIQAREKGRLRAIGVSCHSLDALREAVDCEEIQVHLVRINPFQVKMDGSPSDVSAQIARGHNQGRGIIGMKIFGEGAFKTPEQRMDSIRYVLGLGTVHAFTIGFTSAQQVDETLSMIEKAAA